MAPKREIDDRGPVRTCIVTRDSGPPEGMIRFVAGPDGQVVPDLKRNLPGRGVWVQLSAAHVKTAVKRKAFARGLRQQVVVRDDLAEEIERLLRRDVLQALSFANKAGEVVTGFFKVETALNGGKIAAVVHATDGAADGIRKISQAVRRTISDGGRPVQVIAEFDSRDLSLALGREHVIHAALEAGPATAGLLTRWARLNAYRGAPEPSATSPTDQPGDSAPD